MVYERFKFESRPQSFNQSSCVIEAYLTDAWVAWKKERGRGVFNQLYKPETTQFISWTSSI